MKISICLIATNRYKELVQDLLVSINQFFLPGHDITVHLFIDEFEHTYFVGRLMIIKHHIASYGFPEATLYRYKIMTSIPLVSYGDYIFYIDADMRIVAPVGNEILHDLVAVRHPGYYNGGGGWETNKKSMSYIPEPEMQGLNYYAGGFQGGKTSRYYWAMQQMAAYIRLDEESSIIPVWHDETAWNYFIYSRANDATELNPDYCMPEPIEKRTAWGIDHFEPKILALEKPENFRNNEN